MTHYMDETIESEIPGESETKDKSIAQHKSVTSSFEWRQITVPFVYVLYNEKMWSAHSRAVETETETRRDVEPVGGGKNSANHCILSAVLLLSSATSTTQLIIIITTKTPGIAPPPASQ